MISILRDYSRHIYFFGILFLAASLPLSIYTTSISEIILLLNWILEGDFRTKFRRLKNRKSILFIMSLYVLHLIGLLYSDPVNVDYALKDLKIKLPILLLPLIIGTSPGLNKKQLKILLLLFSLATLSSTLVSFAVFLGIIPYEYYDFRDISIFISHIRLALMVNFSIFILIYYMFNNNEKLRFRFSCSIISSIIILWFIFFFVLLKSLTGLFIFLFLILVIGWFYSARLPGRYAGLFIRSVILMVPFIVASFIANSIQRFYTRAEINFSSLEDTTALGNPYMHDTLRKARENGHYLWVYIAEDEMKNAWNSVSNINYDSLDKKGQAIQYTIMRYLTSKGLRKDAAGVKSLSEEDIHAIENGKANYIFKNKFSLYPRVYEVIWEIDGYLKGRDPSGHSIAQRIAYLNAARSIFLNNPWIGVGTGDVQSSFSRYYKQSDSKLKNVYRRRAHNQYVTFLITFGVLGFILAVVFLIAPVFKEKAWRDYLSVVFFVIAFLSMLNEDTLETQTGVSFFMFFYSLLLFGRKKTKDEKELFEKGT